MGDLEGSAIFTVFDDRQKDKLLSVSGCTLLEVIGVFELEYVKDESGRQILSLDEPFVQERMLRRLVERGMNPLAARQVIKDAVKDFRSDADSHIFFLKRETF